MLKRLTRSMRLKNESGQAAALIALLLFFAFLAFASLAIDGGLFYLARRDLQNVADASALAACRVIASGGDTTAATIAAQTTIQTNLGSWTEYATPTAGSGVNLTRGIEVSEADVRVALQRPVPTVLKQFLAQPQTIALAQAHCDSRSGGGLMPIAIPRYDCGDPCTMTDYLAIPGAPPYPSDSITVTWPGRYGPFDVPVPTSAYAASDSSPGPEVVILGQSADTNNGESAMRDLVLLDIRNVASDVLEYYNGADSQANAAKDMSQDWIYQHGYPGPYPPPGSQVAILEGASNNFTARAMDAAGYRPGDVVAVLIYDGFVWTKPDFLVELTPSANAGIATVPPVDESTAVEYTVEIKKGGGANARWWSPLSFNLAFDFSQAPLPPGTHVKLGATELMPGLSHDVLNVTEAGWSGTLRIWNTEAITRSHLSGLNLIATSTSLKHGASSNFGFGTIGAYDYALRSNHGRLVVRQGDNNAKANPITFGKGASIPGGQGCKNVPITARLFAGPTELPWDSYLEQPQTVNVNIPKDEKGLDFPLSVKPGATTGSYRMRFSVGPNSSNCGAIPQHALEIPEIPLEILPPAPTADPDKYVIVQGYAVFRITRVDANDVWGQAIRPPNAGSSLVGEYSKLVLGLQARLIPWER